MTNKRRHDPKAYHTNTVGFWVVKSLITGLSPFTRHVMNYDFISP